MKVSEHIYERKSAVLATEIKDGWLNENRGKPSTTVTVYKKNKSYVLRKRNCNDHVAGLKLA